VFYSNDFGANWSYYHTGLDTLQRLYCFELDSNYIYGGGVSCGVWKRSLSDFPLGVVEVRNSEHLSAYPNPFSTETTLLTDNPLNNASLAVFNSFGQIVVNLEKLNGSTIILHRNNLARGLYFARLIQDDRIIASGKLVIAD
jgi:hypothetical protein